MKYLIIILLALASCRTTRNVQKFTKQVDSTGFFKRDSSRVVRVDSVSVDKDKSVSVEEKKNDYEEWTVIEEYKDTPVIKKTTIHIKDKGVSKTKVITVSDDSTSMHKSDSGVVKTDAVVRKITDESGKDLQVKKTQGGLWINLVILVVILLVLYYIYRKYLRW